MSTIAIAAIGIPLLVMAALFGHIVVRKKVDFATLREHQGTGQAVLGLVGTLFSVLIGFLVVSSLDTYHDARQHEQSEANALGNIFRLAHGLGEVDRPRIRRLCREYCDTVISEEWPMMEHKHLSTKAWKTYETIWDAVVSVKPRDERESAILQAILPATYTFGESRRARAVDCQLGMSPALAIVIFVGALLTIGITYSFSGDWVGYQRVMITVVSISLGLNMWLLVVFNEPFSGELKIKPDAFILDRDIIFQGPDTLPEFLQPKP